MENNKVEYKWKKLFASINNVKGKIELTPIEAQELIDDISTLRDNNMTKCSNCGELVEMIALDEICPKCSC